MGRLITISLQLQGKQLVIMVNGHLSKVNKKI